MAPKLTDELRQELQKQPGRPIEVEDEETQTAYVIVAKESFLQLVDKELRRQLQIGFDQADAGDVAEWNIDEILDEAHRRHSRSSS